MATVRRHNPIVDDSITLRSDRKLAYCVHGVENGVPIIFFCGAGFGRTYVPTPDSSLLETQNVRFITVDRPGYGDSTPQEEGRTYRDWVGDVQELMDHLCLDKARFLAHSAGTPHLVAVCAFAPERVVAASLVCPVSPIVGEPPIDRPNENFSRGCGRLMAIYAGGFLDKVFGYVFQQWQRDPKQFVRDTMSMIAAGKDIAFMKEHSDLFEGEFVENFGQAVHEPHGVPAMLQDMFHINSVPWGFSYAQIARSKSGLRLQVWYGSADDTAPHGKWICEQLGIEGTQVEDAGHGLIHNEFEEILRALVRIQ